MFCSKSGKPFLHRGWLAKCVCLVCWIVCTQTGEKSRDDALEAIKGNLDGFSRDAKMHPSQTSQTKKQGMFLDVLLAKALLKCL